jgi:steroid delta-isomerase
MSTAAIKKLIADYFAATRAMDAQAWVATFAEDAVVYDPVSATPIQGQEAIRQLFQNLVDLL